MHWQIGIDEAGYGPNLGPFVMVGVGFRSSQAASLPLWEALAPGVGRADAPAHRLAVDDSKRIYTSGSRRGLQRLEAATLAFPWEADGLPTTCAQLLQRIAAESLAGLAQEPSFQPDTALPHWADPDWLSTQAWQLGRLLDQLGLARPRLAAVIICPSEFNALLDTQASKSAVLHAALTRIVQTIAAWAAPADTLALTIDQQGGRLRYAAMLHAMLPDAWVEVIAESPQGCQYQLTRHQQVWTVRLAPRADQLCLETALASMVAKYLRELLMAQFNRYWCAQVAGLRPTAGYPVDAARFRAAVGPRLAELGLAESTLWRRK